VSGAVRGRAIVNGSEDEKDHTSPDPKDHITFKLPDEGMSSNEHAMVDNSEEPDHMCRQHRHPRLSLDGHLSSDRLHSASASGVRSSQGSPIAHSWTLLDRMLNLETPHGSSRDSDLGATAAFRRSQARTFSGSGVGARPDPTIILHMQRLSFLGRGR
jgi:hypothetical protein